MSILVNKKTKLLVQGIAVATRFTTAGRRLHRGNVVAVVVQQQRQDLAVPTAARRDLDYRLVRPDAEELQGGLGMAIYVTCRIGG